MPTESLRRVRDLFVFQTYTMMGYSDLERFDYKDCFKVNGQMAYKSNRVKTGKEFTFALLKPAMDILRKYNFKLPIISNVKYNLYLKAAVKYAKIDKPVSCHWARHTGATLLLNKGKMDLATISKILGDTLRETEKTYAKLLDTSIVDSMVEFEKSAKVGDKVG
jgi:integrase